MQNMKEYIYSINNYYWNYFFRKYFFVFLFTFKKQQDKQNKSIEDLTYDILGNAFVGNLFDISNDIDNTSQNLVAYLELEDIKKLSKKHKGNIEEK